MKTAVIERKYIGGSCPNIACLPSKNVIHSAKVASYFRRSEEFGISKDNWKIDMPAVRERKRKMVTVLVEMHLDLYKKSGAELVMGSGRFVGLKTIEVTSADGLIRLLHGKRVVINTGTHATIGPIPGLAEANPLTHIEALDLDRIPEAIAEMHRLGLKIVILTGDNPVIHPRKSFHHGGKAERRRAQQSHVINLLSGTPRFESAPRMAMHGTLHLAADCDGQFHQGARLV